LKLDYIKGRSDTSNTKNSVQAYIIANQILEIVFYIQVIILLRVFFHVVGTEMS
jgi:hypothetical protein